jgi:hypothetical protein
MAGFAKQDAKMNLNGVVNRDLLQRLKFLYQASAYLNSILCQSNERFFHRYFAKNPNRCFGISNLFTSNR